MEFRVLGPFEAIAGGASLGLGGPQQRAMLAVLALRVNEVIPVGAEVDAGRPYAASAMLGQALALWRGDVLADLPELAVLRPVHRPLPSGQEANVTEGS